MIEDVIELGAELKIHAVVVASNMRSFHRGKVDGISELLRERQVQSRHVRALAELSE